MASSTFRVPKKLKIGPHVFTFTRDASTLPDGETMGFNDPQKNRITVAPNLPKTQELVTTIHEIFHAYLPELDEVIIDALAQGAAQVLIDNKLIKL